MVLDPIIPEKGLVMLYAIRGTGKTHVALGVAYAVATGSTFLKWRAPRPRRVLVVDGEMPAPELRERLEQVDQRSGGNADAADAQNLPVDMIERGIGTLACPEVQAELDPWLAGVELLVLDNLSSLTAALRENDSDSWSPIQDWLLRLRRRGISVLIVHHAGKTGGQRGTSRREDVLDTSISLRHPSDYAPEQGARFEVHIDKGRGIHGEQAQAVRGVARRRQQDGGLDHEGDRGPGPPAGGGAARGRPVAARGRRGARHLEDGGAPAQAADRAGRRHGAAGVRPYPSFQRSSP